MRVIIKAEVKAKVQTWVDNCDIECSGLGKVIKQENGDMLVVDAMLLKQECDSVATTLAPDAIGKAMFETREAEGDLNWWWHSHVDMDVFWSKTDADTIDELSDQGYCLATVFNKQGEMHSAYKHKNLDLIPNLFMDNLETVVKYIADTELVDKWKKELEEKVAEVFPVHCDYWKGLDDKYATGQGWSGGPYVPPSEPPKAIKGLAWKGKKGNKKNKKNKKWTGAAKVKKEDNTATLTHCPDRYYYTSILPTEEIEATYLEYTKYFKQVPTLEDLEDFYEDGSEVPYGFQR